MVLKFEASECDRRCILVFSALIVDSARTTLLADGSELGALAWRLQMLSAVKQRWVRRALFGADAISQRLRG
jgi:hypothetical protein